MVARICCLDLDTFFVSVERLFDPNLEGRPVIVGGPRGSRGVVTAASYEVRAYGVRSGMSMRDASRLAPPDAVFVKPRHGVYGEYSARVRTVLDGFTPDVRAASIDEFYLDFSGCEGLYNRGRDEDGDATIERAVRDMCRAVREQTGLPASAGIGANRIIAKVASGCAKPQGVLLVPEGAERDFLLPMPVRRLPGIGPKAEARMLAQGIHLLGDLVNLPDGTLRASHSRILAVLDEVLAGRSRQPAFIRERPAFLEHDPGELAIGSISNERTFFDTLGTDSQVLQQLLWLAERVCWRARKRGIGARTISLKLRYSDFTTLLRSHTVRPTSDESIVFRTVRDLYRENADFKRRVRLLGVALSNLVGSDSGRQLELPFDNATRVGNVIDEVRAKYGYDSVHWGEAARLERHPSTRGGLPLRKNS